MSRPLALALLMLAGSPVSLAAGFYKYVDADGVVTYGNRQPDGLTPQPGATPPKGTEPLYGAINTTTGQQVLQARLQQDIVQHLLQRHQPQPHPEQGPASGYRYARPWQGGHFPISQGFHGNFSHNTVQSRHALDIAMPEGTPLYAARAGTVVKMKNDVQGRGSSANGNYLRILHEDGTSSAYLHLQQGSIVVRPGQQVARGQYLGRSGNTGRSTGPHLHFVVQRAVNGGYESIPFAFEGETQTLPELASSQN